MGSLDESFDLAREQVRYWRDNGLRPEQAIRAVGLMPERRVGWDDAVWVLGRALHTLRWGAPEE